jgi:hypothetical protein
MLATIGFSITGILFILFSMTIQSLGGKSRRVFNRYAQAYNMLAAAFILWGIASAIGKREILAFSVVVGDILLLMGTILILGILLDHNTHKKQWLYAAAFIGIGLLVVRTIFFYPKPFMTDQILFFNSQRFVSFVITATLLLIWLPVNVRISNLVTQKAQFFTSTYTLLYAAATISAAIFLLAKAPLTVVLSFTALSISFLVLVITNFYIKQLGGRRHGKQRTSG